MKILIIGGDGYLGWPLSLHLSAQNFDVHIVDNFIRRQYDLELSTQPLVPISTMKKRLRAWKKITGKKINFYYGDVTNYSFISSLFKRIVPDVAVHLGEQRSAPYSMIDVDHAVHTQVNNIVGTLNIVFSIKASNLKCHFIKLGSMGEYGTPNIDIEEGFIEINHKGRKDILPFPKSAGSFYHLSKVHDSNNLEFVSKVWNLKITDLNQGVVYGYETEETKLDETLNTRFDYDHVFGTALNRFCVEVANKSKITVYGGGEQTRGFLNIKDTLQCINLVINNPPEENYAVFNQFTEVFSVLELAKLVLKNSKLQGIDTEISHLNNPRIEKDRHYYNPSNDKFKRLGLNPQKLDDETILSMIKYALKYRGNIDTSQLKPKITWKN